MAGSSGPGAGRRMRRRRGISRRLGSSPCFRLLPVRHGFCWNRATGWLIRSCPASPDSKRVPVLIRNVQPVACQGAGRARGWRAAKPGHCCMAYEDFTNPIPLSKRSGRSLVTAQSLGCTYGIFRKNAAKQARTFARCYEAEAGPKMGVPDWLCFILGCVALLFVSWVLSQIAEQLAGPDEPAMQAGADAGRLGVVPTSSMENARASAPDAERNQRQ